MPTDRDTEFAEYVAARLPSLRRLALLLCQDWHVADDLVQAGIIKLYVHWRKARAAEHPDAYVRTIIVREFLRERRTSWARRVRLTAAMPDSPAAACDTDASMDLQAAIARLPAGQRAVLVLRYYCDLPVEQAAEVLGCSPGTIKSQTAKALASLRRVLGVTEGDTASARSAARADVEGT